MKKVWQPLLLAVVLAMALCVGALAADNEIGIYDIGGTGAVLTPDTQKTTKTVDGEEYTDYCPGAVKFDVTASGTAGQQYLLLVLNAKATPTVNNIVYIDQTAADGNGNIAFAGASAAYPRELTRGAYYVYLVGDGKTFSLENPSVSFRYDAPKTEHEKTLTVTQDDFTYGKSDKLNPSATLGNQSVKASFTYTNSKGEEVETPTDAGTYTVTARYETDTDIYTGETTFTIAQKALTSDMLTVSGTYTYKGTTQAVDYEVKDGSKTLTVDKDYTVSGNTEKNAGPHTVTVTGQGNYTGEVSKEWSIAPAELTASITGTVSKVYGAEIDISKINVNLEPVFASDDVTATVKSITFTGENVGTYNATASVELSGEAKNNYKLKNGTIKTEVEITKAPHDDVQVGSVSGMYGSTVEIDLESYLPDGYSLSIKEVYDNCSIIQSGSAKIEGTKLKVTLVNDARLVDKSALIDITVISTNYQKFEIGVNVKVTSKTPQTITAKEKNIEMTYGDAAKQITASDNVGELSYAVTDGEGVVSVDANGKVTALKAGTAVVTITAAETDTYAEGTATVTATVAHRALTITAEDKTAYVGAQQPELTYKADGLLEADKETLSDVTLSVSAPEGVIPMNRAGTYDIVVASATYDTDKYELTTEKGTLTVRTRPGSGTTTGSTGSVSIDRPANGTVTVSPANPVKGSTVTITVTPDKGQTLKDLEVLDKNGNSLPLTDLGNGKFSFVMPEGDVTIKSEFGEENAFVNPYDDVKPGDWYYSAVEYVTVNGLMNGTGKGFEPNLATSRAMIWTILARMSGVNTASSGEWYAVAQQWAVTNGVSDGTMPNNTITREQLAAMLYRYAVSKGMVKGPATADLSVFADANSVSSYAVEAMQWAVSTGLIGGMDGKLNPQGSATRAQVATMLMRFAELGRTD